jgi:hypothetical protein
MLLLLLKDPGLSCEGLRLRIGCARMRRSRRGVGGWPCLLLVVSVSRRRRRILRLEELSWLMEFAFKRLLNVELDVAYFAGVWGCKGPVVNVRKLTGCENVLDGQWKQKGKCAWLQMRSLPRNYFLREDDFNPPPSSLCALHGDYHCL